MSGRPRSTVTNTGSNSWTAVTPSVPLAAAITSKPDWPNRATMSPRMSSSSSTTTATRRSSTRNTPKALFGLRLSCSRGVSCPATNGALPCHSLPRQHCPRPRPPRGAGTSVSSPCEDACCSLRCR
ncbi:hypothetical protein ACFFX0_09590 [Citricoccus parietis]|uniref:Uncharacterized protein n=1 Tax=Citricoccus parietis TaxID=592307 RepID=A0ABV5FXM2_9MICC